MKKLIILNIVLSLISINCWADTPLITNPKQIKDSVKESIVSNTTSYNILKSSINRLNTDLQSFKNDVRISTNSINTDLQNYKINVRTSTNSINIDLQNFKNDVRTSTNNIITDLQNFKTEVSTTYVRKDGDTINGNLTVNGIFGVGSMGVWTAGGITSLGDVRGNRLCINNNCISEWGNGGGSGGGSGKGFNFNNNNVGTIYGNGDMNTSYIFYSSGSYPYMKLDLLTFSNNDTEATLYIKGKYYDYDKDYGISLSAPPAIITLEGDGRLSISDYNGIFGYKEFELLNGSTYMANLKFRYEDFFLPNCYNAYDYKSCFPLSIFPYYDRNNRYSGLKIIDSDSGIKRFEIKTIHNLDNGEKFANIELKKYDNEDRNTNTLTLSPHAIGFSDYDNNTIGSIYADNGLNLGSNYSLNLYSNGTIDVLANTRIILNVNQGDMQIYANDGVFINQGVLYVGRDNIRRVFVCDGGTLDGVLVSNSYKCVGGVAKRTKLYLSVE